MVGIVKTTLKKALGRCIPNFETLLTFLNETEAVVNSRPLTYVYEDGEKSLQFLRPIDFIIPHGQIGTEVFSMEDCDDPDYLPTIDSTGKLFNLWKQNQKFIDKLWEFFRSEYLATLHERFQTTHKQPRSTKEIIPKKGLIVLIMDNNIPRGFWKLGRIHHVHWRSDNQPSSVDVLTPSGKILKRPINLLCPLEIEMDEESMNDKAPKVTENQHFNGVKPKQHPVKESPKPTLTTNDLNRRTTRSMTRKSKNTSKMVVNHTFLEALSKGLLYITMLFCIVQYTHASQCTGNTETLEVVDSQSCVQEGYIIKRNKNGVMCWKRMKCDGHLQKTGKCGPSCPCPKWATSCVYNQKHEPVDTTIQQEILENEKPKICSFQENSHCNTNLTTEQFHQIQLLDNSTHFVKQLNIKIAEVTSEQYTCIGTGKQGGTPEFCKTHECLKFPTKFCMYMENDRAYFVSDFGSLPIKSWGSVPVSYYPEKNVPSDFPSCKTCDIKCVQGGVKIELEENLPIGKLLICSDPVCYSIEHPKHQETVMFPAEINLHNHDVKLKIWSKGYMIKQLGIQCKSQPFCETINNDIMAIISNPHCAPKSALFVLFILLYFGSVTVFVFLKIFKYLFYVFWVIFKFLKWLLHFCIHLCSHQPNDLPTTTKNEDKRRKQRFIYQPKPTILATIIFFATFFPSAESCSAATMLTATTRDCTPWEKDESFQQCTLTEVTRLALVPQGQNTCLMIKKPDGTPLGTLKLQIEQIQMVCKKKNEYFTRSYKMDVVASKRCSHSGSCHGEKCNAYNKDSKIEELNGEAYKYPGFTYCQDSCGCWGCQCFFCDDGCLFYRTYATPSSTTTYEVFSCPIWEFSIDVKLSMHGSSGKITTHKLILKPGIKMKWRNLEITLIGIVSPPTPILGKTFITDKTRTILAPTSNSGQPVAGTIGALQCSNEEAGKEFKNCFLPHDICQCVPQGEKVSCTCANMDIEPLFEDAEYVLPLKMSGLTISNFESTVTAEFHSIASLEAQVSMTNLHLTFLSDKSTCKISPGQFEGCYSCITSAQLNYICTTDKGEALAYVSCGQGSFTAQCNASGINSTTTMAFHKAQIKEQCDVTCNGGTTNFQLEGTLTFVNKHQLSNTSNIIAGTDNESDPKLNKPDLSFLLDFLGKNWLIIILIVIGVILLVLFTIAFFPQLISCVHDSFQKFSKKTLYKLQNWRQKKQKFSVEKEQ